MLCLGLGKLRHKGLAEAQRKQWQNWGHIVGYPALLA